MKSTGIVRKVDELGRIVIPKELRRTFNIAEGDSIEIYTNGDSIVLKKFQTSCVFCGEKENLNDYLGSKVCFKCVTKIRNLRK